MTPDLDLINHAAAQTDRWMFIALLVIGIAAISILFKYFTGRLDSLQARMDKQTEDFVAHLKTAHREMLEIISANQQTTTRAISIMERVERKLG